MASNGNKMSLRSFHQRLPRSFWSGPFFSRRGQGLTAEYAILIAIAVGSITAMATFIKRTLKARAYDAHIVLIDQARRGSGNTVVVAPEYEAYFVQTSTNTDTVKMETESRLSGQKMGKISNSVSATQGTSVQLPPGMFR